MSLLKKLSSEMMPYLDNPRRMISIDKRKRLYSFSKGMGVIKKKGKKESAFSRSEARAEIQGLT